MTPETTQEKQAPGYDIRPTAVFHSTHKQGELNRTHETEITAKLGFPPNGGSYDDGKVTVEWEFFANGHRCAVWDYKGSAEVGRFSFYGPLSIFTAIFGDKASGY